MKSLKKRFIKFVKNFNLFAFIIFFTGCTNFDELPDGTYQDLENKICIEVYGKGNLRIYDGKIEEIYICNEYELKKTTVNNADAMQILLYRYISQCWGEQYFRRNFEFYIIDGKLLTKKVENDFYKY